MGLQKTVFGRLKYKPNTFIGGVSATINTPALIATKLGISVIRIKAFSVIGSDIQFAVIGGSYVIASGAFHDNSNITYFNDRDGLMTNTSSNCFRAAVNLVYTILPNVTSIAGSNSTGSGAFFGCTALQYVIAPKVTYIGFYGYGNCSNLLTADHSLLNGLGVGAFFNCIKIVIPSSTLRNITTLNQGWEFTNCYSQIFFDLRNVTSISGKCTFENCSLVTGYNLDNLLNISGLYNFRNNSSLENIVFPKLTGFTGRGNVTENSTEGLFKSNVKLQTFSAPLCASAIPNLFFNGCTSIGSINLQSCSDLGGYSYNGLSNGFFNGIKTNCSITVPTSLLTVAGGSINPDLSYAINSRNAIVTYV